MSITSPQFLSSLPLALLTSREGSRALTSATSASVSCWPWDSLKTTHMMMEGWFQWFLTMLTSSVLNCGLSIGCGLSV